jgi:hypothetical protein
MRQIIRVTPWWSFESPPFLKGDLGGLSKPYIIPPDPPLKKGGNGHFFP